MHLQRRVGLYQRGDEKVNRRVCGLGMCRSRGQESGEFGWNARDTGLLAGTQMASTAFGGRFF